MAKRRRQRVIGLLPLAGRSVSALWRWTLAHPQPWITTVVLTVGLWALCATAPSTAVFRITHIEAPEGLPLRWPASLIGTNLWRVNLRQLSEDFSQQQPTFKEILVIRQLPDTLRLEAVPRVPVAQVHLEQWYPVDREGFLIPDGHSEGIEGLVRIVGLGRSGPLPRPGKLSSNTQLAVALRVLEVLHRIPTTIARRITEINVTDPQQIRLLLDGTMEVRCGQESELPANLARLSMALKAISKQQLAVRYIDVRFQEPVVGPRTSMTRTDSLWRG